MGSSFDTGNVFISTHRTRGLSDASLDDRGRLTLPKEARERYGEHYYIVQLSDGIKLVPVADDPLGALRDEFADIDESADELREKGRKAALDEAGR